MQITNKIILDMQRKALPQIDAVQNDAGTRAVKAVLYDGGTEWAPPEGVTVSVAYRKADNTGDRYDTLPDGAPAGSVSGNEVTVVLAPIVLTAPGRVKASIVFEQADGARLATFPFEIMVSADPSATALDSVRAAYAEGQQAEHYRFFDSYQKHGNRSDWDSAFYGEGWTDETYNPIHAIRGSIPNTFRASKLTNTLVPIVVTGSTTNAFGYAAVVTIPSIDLTNATNTTTCFNKANKLKDVTFVGVIPSTVNLQSASGMTVASMKSAIFALVNYAGTDKEYANSLMFPEDCWVTLEADSTAPDGGTWRNYVGSLGWLT